MLAAVVQCTQTTGNMTADDNDQADSASCTAHPPKTAHAASNGMPIANGTVKSGLLLTYYLFSVLSPTLHIYNFNRYMFVIFSAGFGSTKSLLIVDARSYTAALANRAKGGGVESAGKLFINLRL